MESEYPLHHKVRPHAVAFPLPAQGHLNPLMRFCRTLASRHGFLITFVNIHPIHLRILHCSATETHDQDLQLHPTTDHQQHPHSASAPSDNHTPAISDVIYPPPATGTSDHPHPAHAALSDRRQTPATDLQQQHAPAAPPVHHKPAISDVKYPRPATATSDHLHPAHAALSDVQIRDFDDNSAYRIRKISIPIDGLDLDKDFRLSFADFLTATLSLREPVERLLQAMSEKDSGLPPVTCVISDNFMSYAIQGVAEKLGIPWVSYFPCSQTMNLLYFYSHTGSITLEDAIRVSVDRGMPMDIFCDDLRGMPVMHNRDMPNYKHVVEETTRLMPIMVDMCKIANEKASAIAVNSFEDLEGEALQAMAEQLPGPCNRIYAVGPLTEVLEGEYSMSLWREDEDCIKWLDEQPEHSVLYISFGSITLVTPEQFSAILAGLEASGKRFLWAFRPDLVEGSAGAAGFLFPAEFVDATRNRACMVEWAPQTLVLKHPSVGGFLTHCGWNSIMEAIAAGVPMLCWPYLCDQHPNAKFVEEVWRVGLRFQAASVGGRVGREEVERVVRAVMEGEEGRNLRRRAASLSCAALRSLEAGGSSNESLDTLVHSLLDDFNVMYQEEHTRSPKKPNHP